MYYVILNSFSVDSVIGIENLFANVKFQNEKQSDITNDNNALFRIHTNTQFESKTLKLIRTHSAKRSKQKKKQS